MPSISLGDFPLLPEYFDIDSELHGINHTCRVQFLTLVLGAALKKWDETLAAFCAAYVHDMARKHDQACAFHGTWAAQSKVPLFREQFMKYIPEAAIRSVERACINHCQDHDYSKDDPDYLITSLLKDADALDRARFGDHNLHVYTLRYQESKSLIDFARYLVFSTRRLQQTDLKSLFSFASVYTDPFILNLLEKIILKK